MGSTRLTSSLIMKFMGLFSLLCLASLCLLTPSSAAPTFDPITAAAFTTAGGLVLTTAGAGTITIPTTALLATKAIAVKGLLVHPGGQEQEQGIGGRLRM